MVMAPQTLNPGYGITRIASAVALTPTEFPQIVNQVIRPRFPT